MNSRKLSLLVQALDERAKDIREWGVREQDSKTVAGILEDARDALTSQSLRHDADALKRKLVGLADSLGGEDEETIMEAVRALAQQTTEAWACFEDEREAHIETIHQRDAALAQQAQPEMATREMIADIILHHGRFAAADAVLALFAPKEARPMYCASCGGPYGHPEPCGA